MHGISLDHVHGCGGSPRFEHLFEDGNEPAVTFDGRDGSARLGQGQGQRPETGPHFQHPVTGADTGDAGDTPDGIGIGHEVLPEGAARRNPVVLEQPEHLGPRKGHGLILVRPLGASAVQKSASAPCSPAPS